MGISEILNELRESVMFYDYYGYSGGILGGLLDFEVLFITIFVASLLWTFGVHFIKLEEERFLEDENHKKTVKKNHQGREGKTLK